MDIALNTLYSGTTNIKARLTNDTRNLVVSYGGNTTAEFKADGGEVEVGSEITAQISSNLKYDVIAADGTDKILFEGKLTKPANWSFVKFNVVDGKLEIEVSGSDPFDTENNGTAELTLGDDGCLYGDWAEFNEFMASLWGIYKWDNANLALKHGKIIQTK